MESNQYSQIKNLSEVLLKCYADVFKDKIIKTEKEIVKNE